MGLWLKVRGAVTVAECRNDQPGGRSLGGPRSSSSSTTSASMTSPGPEGLGVPGVCGRGAPARKVAKNTPGPCMKLTWKGRPASGPNRAKRGRARRCTTVYCCPEGEPEVQQEARPGQAGGVAAGGVDGDVDPDGDEPQPHGQGRALTEHPAVAGPDTHGQSPQRAEDGRPDHQGGQDPRPSTARHVVAVG